MKSLYESLLDGYDAIEKNIVDNIKGTVYDHLRRNYLRHSSFKISRKPNADGMYEVTYKHTAPLVFKGTAEHLTNMAFVFVGDIHGLTCENCPNLKDLVGAPEVLNGRLKIVSCPNLESLEGAPKTVNNDIELNNLPKITSLEGISQEGIDNFWVFDLYGLKSLKGSPKKIKGTYELYNCFNLPSLEGMPKEVGEVKLSRLRDLTSLKGMEHTKINGGSWNKIVVDGLYIRSCENISNLSHMPKDIKGSIRIEWNNKLENLKGMPDVCTERFKLVNCNGLTSLEGMPRSIFGYCYITGCPELTSLEGLSKKIHDRLIINDCGKDFGYDEVSKYCDIEEKNYWKRPRIGD